MTMFSSFSFCLRDRKSYSIIFPLSVCHLHYLPIHLVVILVLSFYRVKNSKIIQIHFSSIKYYEELKALLLWSLCNHILFIILVFSISILGKRITMFYMEKAMAPHSSTLAWKILWTEEPGRLQSIGLLRVGHDSATSLSLFTHTLEKEMATRSSVLAWRIPGTGEPGGLPSLGLYRVGHDWSNLAAAASFILEQLPVNFLYGKYRSICGSCSLFNYSTLLLQHKRYKNKWVWLSSNKYLWTHIQISYNFHVIKYFF